MVEITCAIAERRIKPREEPPLLTLFVPTFNRTTEMVQTLECLAGQLKDGLETKVEILISDNASDASGRDAVRALADRFEAVSYVINATDQGGHFQVYTAPWRSRGVWTWVFGSDDLLAPGAMGHVISRLEHDDPSFLTMDKQIWNRDLSHQLHGSTNAIPDRNFGGFVDLFKSVGIYQLCHLSVAVEKSDVARKIDPRPYLFAECYHNYTIAYFEKHQDRKCVYLSNAHVIRRLGNDVIRKAQAVVSEDMGLNLPLMLMNMARPFGVGDDFLEQVNGSWRIDSYDPPVFTMVDNIFEYMLRAIAQGTAITFFQKAAVEELVGYWAPHRRQQFEEIWTISEAMRRATDVMDQARERYEELVIEIAAKRAEVHALSYSYRDKKPA